MKFFVTLQLADVVTTLVFLSMGLAETNPLAEHFMNWFGPVPGLLILKGLAISIALLCRLAASPRFFRRVNAVYAIVVAMNLLTIVTAKRA
jgi:hypothetical protein